MAARPAPFGHSCAPEQAGAKAISRGFSRRKAGHCARAAILGASMPDAEYSTRRALLVAELEAAKLQREGADDLVALVRELLELSLDAGDVASARTALAELEAVSGPDDPGSGVLVGWFAARVALAGGDPAGAVEASERAVALARELELESDLPHLLEELAEGLDAAERADEAKKALAEAAALFESTEQLARAGLAKCRLASRAAFDEAPALFRSALELTERSGERRLSGVVLYGLGVWHAERDEYLPARHALERSLKIARDEAEPLGAAACLEHLAWLETDAFHHREAIELATEALAAATDDWQRARALDARANARHRLHEHVAARADLLEAAQAFDAAGQPDWATDCRRRAGGDRVLHYLHYLPSWVFRHKDMSTRASAMRRERQPFYWWVAGFTLVWTVGFALGAMRASSPSAKKLLLVVGLLPLSFAASTVSLALGTALVQRYRAKRGA